VNPDLQGICWQCTSIYNDGCVSDPRAKAWWTKVWEFTNHQVVGSWVSYCGLVAFGGAASLIGGIWCSNQSTPVAVTAAPTTREYRGVIDANVVVADISDLLFDRFGENLHVSVGRFTMLPARRVRWEIVDRDVDAVDSFNVAVHRSLSSEPEEVMLRVRSGQITDSFEGETLVITRVHWKAEPWPARDPVNRVRVRAYRVE
jgi:hypothetical protein